MGDKGAFALTADCFNLKHGQNDMSRENKKCRQLFYINHK